MSRNIIKDYFTLIVISFFIVKSLNIFFIKILIAFRITNIFLMLKRHLKEDKQVNCN